MKVWEETWGEIDGVICDASKNAHFRSAFEEAKKEGLAEEPAAERAWEKMVEEAQSRFSWEDGVNYGAFGDMDNASPFNPSPRDVERTKLTSYTPEMARMLMRVTEYIDSDDGRIPTIRDDIEKLLKKAGV